MSALFIRLIDGYRLLWSSWNMPRCRFYPSCSHYAQDAFRAFGFWKASWKIILRLSRCHPWNPGGVDPVYKEEL